MRHLVDALTALGPVGVILLALLDNLGVPLVGGVDALVVWVSVTNPSAAYLAAGMAVLGSLIGSLVLFLIARKGGEAYLDRHTVSRRAARLRNWFLEYGLLTVFVPAVVPIVPMPLKVFILSAGGYGCESGFVFRSVYVCAHTALLFSSLAGTAARAAHAPLFNASSLGTRIAGGRSVSGAVSSGEIPGSQAKVARGFGNRRERVTKGRSPASLGDSIDCTRNPMLHVLASQPREKCRAVQISRMRKSLNRATRFPSRCCETVTALCRFTAHGPFIPSSSSSTTSDGTPRIVEL